MSRLYDALTALERRRPGAAAARVPPMEVEARAGRTWPAVTVVVVALSGAVAMTLMRSGLTASPSPAVRNPASTAPVSELELRGRARAAAAFGLVDEAESLLRQVVKTAPADAAAWNDLGVVLARRTQFAPAIEALELSVTLDPKSAAAHRNLAVVFEKLGKTAEAALHYREFVALSPEGPERRQVAARLARWR